MKHICIKELFKAQATSKISLVRSTLYAALFFLPHCLFKGRKALWSSSKVLCAVNIAPAMKNTCVVVSLGKKWYSEVLAGGETGKSCEIKLPDISYKLQAILSLRYKRYAELWQSAKQIRTKDFWISVVNSTGNCNASSKWYKKSTRNRQYRSWF